MIIGNGFIANHIKNNDRDDILVFADDVIDSKTTNNDAFFTEEAMLKRLIASNNEKKIFYLSSYSINDPTLSEQIYVKHKIAMEYIVANTAKNFLIIRKSNLFGQFAPEKSILPFICNSIINENEFEVWVDAYRNILDINHFALMFSKIVCGAINNDTIYLVNPDEYRVIDIVRICEKVIGKVARTVNVAQGTKFYYNTVLSEKLFKELDIKRDSYIENLLIKYL